MKCLALTVALCLPVSLIAQQAAPEIQFKAQTDFFKLPPDIFFGEAAKPALGVFHIYLTDIAEDAVLYHATGLFDEGIAGIGMRETEEETGFVDLFLQLQGFFEREGHRFVEDDMKAFLEREHGRREMQVIWRNDGDEIHAFVRGQAAFNLHHLFIREIDAVFRKKEGLAGLLRVFRMAAEGTANEFDQTVHIGSDAMNGANEGVFPAAYHSHS